MRSDPLNETPSREPPSQEIPSQEMAAHDPLTQGPSPRRFGRRQLLLGLLAASATAWAALRLPSSRIWRSPTEQLLAALIRAVPLPDPLTVGQNHLRRHPELARGDGLIRSVFDDLPLGEGTDIPTTVEAFRARAMSEMQRGEIEVADGWYLPRSELLLCTLLAAEI
ncbi:MAG: hypothetical protein MI919_04790 [Holophagales bacterium]|nr:hypothetical protein [Holophagales bacterium]